MTPTTFPLGSRVLRRTMILSVIVALTLAGLAITRQSNSRTASAYFVKTVGIYEGDDVMILGVKVGSITKITPEPDRVRVDFTYDHPVPADVKAVITTPSLVPVRNVTLVPVYRGGLKLADHATIPLSRTAVPVEWDEVKKQLNGLAVALGPNATDKDGALSRAITTSARNVDGNGESFRRTVLALSEAMSTLADNRGEIFGTVRNLEVFVRAIRGADREVATFNRRLADVADVLNDDSGELSTAIINARRAMADLKPFLRDNQDDIVKTIGDVAPLVDMVADSRDDVANILHIGATAVNNLYGLYDPIDGSLTASATLANVTNPAAFLCSMISGLGGTAQQCHDALAPLARLAAVPVPPVGVSPVERNGRSNSVVPRPGPEPDAGTPQARPDLASLMTAGEGQ